MNPPQKSIFPPIASPCIPPDEQKLADLEKCPRLVEGREASSNVEKLKEKTTKSLLQIYINIAISTSQASKSNTDIEIANAQTVKLTHVEAN
ncbi:hypothetical protein ACLOJK_008715 [Asimina triloba]